MNKPDDRFSDKAIANIKAILRDLKESPATEDKVVSIQGYRYEREMAALRCALAD